jgi:hypothetical protein
MGSYTEESDDPELSETVASYVYAGVIDATFDNDRYTAALDGESFAGHIFMANLEDRSRNLDFDLYYWEYSPTFRTGNSFINSRNRREIGVDTWYKIYRQSGVLDRITPSLSVSRRWDFDGVKKQDWIGAEIETRFRLAQARITVGVEHRDEIFRDVRFNSLSSYEVSGRISPGSRYDLGGTLTLARDFARSELVLDNEQAVSLWANLRPLDPLTLEPQLDYFRATNRETDEELFDGYILRVRTNYQPRVELSIRLIAQYDTFYETLEIDPLLTYQLNPFTMFYVGSTSDYTECTETKLSGEGRSLLLASRQIFAKIQYLLHL